MNALLIRLTGLTEGQVAERWPFLWAVLTFPRRTGEAFRDPIRRTHLVVQALVVYLNAMLAAAATCWLLGVWPQGWRPWLLVDALSVGVVLVDYLRYEYVLEPWSRVRVAKGRPSLVRPYWEGGPRDGERFVNE